MGLPSGPQKSDDDPNPFVTGYPSSSSIDSPYNHHHHHHPYSPNHHLQAPIAHSPNPAGYAAYHPSPINLGYAAAHPAGGYAHHHTSPGGYALPSPSHGRYTIHHQGYAGYDPASQHHYNNYPAAADPMVVVPAAAAASPYPYHHPPYNNNNNSNNSSNIGAYYYYQPQHHNYIDPNYPSPSPPDHHNHHRHILDDNNNNNNDTSSFSRMMLVLLIILVTSMCILTLVVWFLFGHYIPDFQVTSMSVAKFCSNNDSRALSGDWNITVAVHNENKDLSVYFEEIVSSIHYEDAVLGSSPLNPFQVTQMQKYLLNMTMPETAYNQNFQGPSAEHLALDVSHGMAVFNLRMSMKASFKKPNNNEVYKSSLLKIWCPSLQVRFSPSGDGIFEQIMGNSCLISIRGSE